MNPAITKKKGKTTVRATRQVHFTKPLRPNPPRPSTSWIAERAESPESSDDDDVECVDDFIIGEDNESESDSSDDMESDDDESEDAKDAKERGAEENIPVTRMVFFMYDFARKGKKNALEWVSTVPFVGTGCFKGKALALLRDRDFMHTALGPLCKISSGDDSEYGSARKEIMHALVDAECDGVVDPMDLGMWHRTDQAGLDEILASDHHVAISFPRRLNA